MSGPAAALPPPPRPIPSTVPAPAAPQPLIAARVAAWVLGLAPPAMMLSGGVFLIAAAAILPPWLELDRTRDQLELMREQTAALAERSDRYQSFLVQLDRGDPVLLERLAHTQLRLQPTGRHSLEFDAGALDAPADVAAWLDVPLPDPARLQPTDRPPATRMERLLAGPTRYGVLLAGAIFAVCGVCWGRGREPAPAEEAPEAEVEGPFEIARPRKTRRAG